MGDVVIEATEVEEGMVIRDRSGAPHQVRSANPNNAGLIVVQLANGMDVVFRPDEPVQQVL